MNTSEKTESRVNIFLYCLKQKSAPSGGLSFENLIFSNDYTFDYSKESMSDLDILLKHIHDQELYAKEKNQKHKDNFLIMTACYIGEYVKQQLSENNRKVHWVDTLDILSSSNKTLDSNNSLWFTSLALHINDQTLLPLMMIRQYLESLGSNNLSTQVSEWIADLKNRNASQISTKISSSQAPKNHAPTNHDSINNSENDKNITNKKSYQNTISSSESEKKTTNNHDLVDLKTTIEQQKNQLISEQKTITKKFVFARLFSNYLNKKTNLSLTAQNDNERQTVDSKNLVSDISASSNTQIIKENTAKSISLESDITNNPTQAKHIYSEAYHPIVEQLNTDKEVENYLPDNEEFIKVIDYNSDPMKELLTEKIKEKNTSAMVALAFFKLEEFFIANPLNENKKLSLKKLQSIEKQTLISIMKLIESAANKDNAAALFFLCSCYEQGFIYEADKTKYNLLLKRSAANGHRRAIKQLSILLKNDFQVPMESQTNQNINDDMILWIVGGLAFAIGFFIFF